MQVIRKFIRGINPFRRNDDTNTIVEFGIQKIIAFLLIYGVASVLGEAVIVTLYSMLGYDILHGEFPTGEFVNAVPLYGFLVFGLLTILYVTKIQKDTLLSIKIQINGSFIKELVLYLCYGIGLVTIMIGILHILGLYSIINIKSSAIVSLIMWFFGYLIQGCTEELMCRGFVLNTLRRRTTWVSAIVISSILFIMPHISSIIDMPIAIQVCAIINLCLISLLFSLLVIREDTIAAACGLHVGWNYALGVLYGLRVSGSAETTGVVQIQVTSKIDILTGGNYGIESSVILIPILVLLNLVVLRRLHQMKSSQKNG